MNILKLVYFICLSTRWKYFKLLFLVVKIELQNYEFYFPEENFVYNINNNSVVNGVTHTTSSKQSKTLKFNNSLLK